MDVVMPARYGTEKSKIKYSKYIMKVAPMIFRGFLWRLKTKYIILDFHPLVFFYVASMVLVPVGVLFGMWIFYQKWNQNSRFSELSTAGCIHIDYGSAVPVICNAL